MVETGNDILFLFKSMKSEYVEDTIKKGRFCFCQPHVFNKWESKDSAQYDPWDSHSAYAVKHIYFASIDGEKDGLPTYRNGMEVAPSAIVHMQTNIVKSTPICCFRIITDNDIKSYHDNDIDNHLSQTAERIIKEFGHDSFIVMRAGHFIDKINHKYSNIQGPVIYKNTLNDYEFHVPEKDKETVEQLFRKDKKYEWQKEYRITLPQSKEEKVFIELGSIEDIAICGKLIDLI